MFLLAQLPRLIMVVMSAIVAIGSVIGFVMLLDPGDLTPQGHDWLPWLRGLMVLSTLMGLAIFVFLARGPWRERA
jgi:hypothetical protein